MPLFPPQLTVRETADLFACFAHTVLLVAICSENSTADWGSAAGLCLIFMQLVAIGAHAFYFKLLHEEGSDFEKKRNPYKWLEYAISATLGTLSVFLSASEGREVNTNTLVLLITLSVTIQTVGYTLDKVGNNEAAWLGEGSPVELLQWSSAAVGQSADFYVVYSAVYGRSDWDITTQNWHYIPYVLGWSAFGVWNLWVLLTVEQKKVSDKNVTIELVYSILSLIAKAFVFGSTGHFLD
jgi:hypothetical protein